MANTTWNNSDKTANITLSGGNLIATATSLATGGVRAVDRVFSGKFYWEITYNTASGNASAGVTSSSAVLSTSPGTNTGQMIGLLRGGTIYLAGINTGITLGAIANGTIVGLALDADRFAIWFRSGAAGNWNASATADPATGTGGISLQSFNNAILGFYPFVITDANANQFTGNFGDTAFAGTAPSGFTAGFPTSSLANTVTLYGNVRETLFTTTAAANAAGVVREVLLATPTAAVLAGVVREVLLLSPPPATAMQTGVAINTG